MGASHTPGPWFWALDSQDQATSLMRSGTGDYVISPQADIGDYGLSVSRWSDVSVADAALISAAPELLEALELILPLAKGYAPEGQTATARATCRSWIEAAEAAITKAVKS